MEPIAYTYEASEHCPECAEKRFGRSARGFIAEGATDGEGNAVGAVFDAFTDRSMVCGTCEKIINALPRMMSYLFSLGNSDTGPVGLCIRVQAEDQDRALAILKENLCLENEIETNALDADEEGVEYIVFYANDAHISLDDIEDEEEVEA